MFEIALPLVSPAWVFLTLMLVALVFPVVAERVGLPGVIGLVIGGLLVGQEGLGLLELPGVVSQLGGFGVLYLMFLAGLELDLDVLQKGLRQAVTFGLLTFALPLGLGLAAALLLGYGAAAAVLIGSFWASHTLVSYPTVRRHGLSRDPAVTATLGATILTDSLALVVLAVVVAIETSTGTPSVIGAQLAIGLSILGVVAFVLLPRLTTWFFRGLGQDGVLRFLFVVCSLLGVAVIADLAGTEPIVGAFFAGLALNRYVPDSGFLMRRIEFVGIAILIPVFLISVGMLIDLSVVTSARTLLLALVFTGVTVVAKYGAARLTAQFFGFDHDRVTVMFSLSVAQAAATLAAAIVGFEAGIIDETTVNAALLVILLTVLLASWTAGRAAPKVAFLESEGTDKLGSRIVVPVANFEAIPRLIELAHMIARADAGAIMPLHVITAPDDEAMRAGRSIQHRAEEVVAAQGAESAGILRVDDSVARGIINVVLETEATLVVTGWTEIPSARRVILGSVMDDIIARVPAPVVVAHLPHLDIEGVVVWNPSGATSVEAQFAQRLGGRVARGSGRRLAVVRSSSSDEAPDDGVVVIEPSDVTDADLVVIAGSGGAEFARRVEDTVERSPHRAMIAIRVFADKPREHESMAGMFGE